MYYVFGLSTFTNVSRVCVAIAGELLLLLLFLRLFRSYHNRDCLVSLIIAIDLGLTLLAQALASPGTYNLEKTYFWAPLSISCRYLDEE